MAELACTPGQTVGPYLHLGLPYAGDNQLVGDAHAGAIRLHGTVYDGVGDAVPDALVEISQPGPDGRLVRREARCSATKRRSPAGADAQPTLPAITASAR